MRVYALRFLVAFLTFSVGILFMYPVTWLASSNTALTPTEAVSTNVADYLTPRFLPSAELCGLSSSGIKYKTNDNQHVFEYVVTGHSKQATKKEFLGIVKKAKQIIERNPLYRNAINEVSERVVLVNVANEFGEEGAMILSYGGGTVYRIIDAPTLDLALEFEQYLIEQKAK